MKRPFDNISGAEMAEWCELLADDNAIHLSREAASAAGYGPRRVNPGPANLSYLLSCLPPEAEETLTDVDAHYAGVVLEGDDLSATLEGERAVLTRDGSALVTATFDAKR